MRTIKMLFFPPAVTTLYKNGEVTIEQLMDIDKWSYILSGKTVTNMRLLNSYTLHWSMHDADLVGLGYDWIGAYSELDDLIDRPALEILLPDGRETEAEFITTQLHNFTMGFDFHRSANGTYLIFLNNMEIMSSLYNRYDNVRSSMGKLINDVQRYLPHETVIVEPIVRSYMNT